MTSDVARPTEQGPSTRLLLSRRQRALIARSAQAALILFVGLVVFGPLVVLAIFSFNDSTILAFPLDGFTTEWYQQAFNNEALRESLWNSIKIAVIVTPVSLLLGTLSAIGLTRFVFRGRVAVGGFIGAPLVLPWLVIGISALLFFDYLGRTLIGVELSLVTAGVMHVVVAYPLVTALVSAQLVSLKPSLEEAALDLGATPREAYRRVIVPLLIPTLATSAIFVFSWSFNNFIVSFFTIGFDSTFPIWVFSSLRRSRNLPVVNSISTAVSVVQILIVWGTWRMLRRHAEKRGQDFGQVLSGGGAG